MTPLTDLVQMIESRYGVDHQGRCGCRKCELRRTLVLRSDLAVLGLKLDRETDLSYEKTP